MSGWALRVISDVCLVNSRIIDVVVSLSEGHIIFILFAAACKIIVSMVVRLHVWVVGKLGQIHIVPCLRVTVFVTVDGLCHGTVRSFVCGLGRSFLVTVLGGRRNGSDRFLLMLSRCSTLRISTLLGWLCLLVTVTFLALRSLLFPFQLRQVFTSENARQVEPATKRCSA